MCRSAAEQLLALTADPLLLGHICQPAHLAAMLSALTSVPDAAASTTSSATAALLVSMDIHLPLAAANLLFACAAGHPPARAWILREEHPSSIQGAAEGDPDSTGHNGSGGLAYVQRALPLLFHSMLSVRRATGRLMAALVLGREADKWSGWAGLSAAGGASGQEARAQVGPMDGAGRV